MDRDGSNARDGSNMDGLFCQNDIESQHFVEKVQQTFKKYIVQATIRAFKPWYKAKTMRKLEPSMGQDLIGIYGFT